MLSHAAGRVDRYRRTGEVTAWLKNDLSTQKTRKNMEANLGDVTITAGGFPVI